MGGAVSDADGRRNSWMRTTGVGMECLDVNDPRTCSCCAVPVTTWCIQGRRRGKRTWWRPRDEPIGARRMMSSHWWRGVGLIWVWRILMNILKV